MSTLQKKLILMGLNVTLAMIVFTGIAAAGEGWYRNGPYQWEKRISLSITNSTNLERKSVPIVLQMKELQAKDSDFRGKNFVIVDPEAKADHPFHLEPVNLESGGNDLPSQADDRPRFYV